MNIQASKGLRTEDKFDVNQKEVRRFINELLRASDSCYWDPVIRIETMKGIKFLLRNPRGILMDDIKAEVKACWINNRLECPTDNKAIIG